MPGNNASWFHNHPIALYLILANGITWLCWLPSIVIASQQGYVLPTIDTYAALFQTGFVNTQHLVLAIVFSLGVYGPLIGAFVASKLDGGQKSVSELWSRIIAWRVNTKWYFYSVLIAILLPAIPVGFGALTGMVEVTALGAITLTYAIFLLFAQILTSGIGEEPGWRGFLLPRLQTRFKGQRHIWILGLIWAVWHYPITTFYTYSMMQDVAPAQMVVTILVSLVVQTISLIGLTFIYVWIYNNTRSVFICILFHALTNLFNFILLSLVVGGQFITPFISLMPWLIVVILKLILGKERFPGQISSAV